MKKIPELLVPAGGMEQLKAAVACGADAVYLGGSSFSARARADNFTEEALKEAVEYAHMYGVRVHVALNTLMTDRELEEALMFAVKIYSYGADAVIVQDMGLFSLIRRCIPGLPIHLSTQGTVTDYQGVCFAAEYGAERVILARELSLDEIAGICRKKGDTEIEIFVHGAICISLSGQCHLSGMIGDRSGNRGDCAQPCRMMYSLEKKEGNPVSKGYQLSPKDMCLLTHLEKIAEAGVDSIKIEGRMKSPEYVAAVTSIYRKHLDWIRDEKPEQALESIQDDLRVLRQMYSRGSFTDSYYKGSAYVEMMSGRSPKHQGLPVGKMNAFYSKSRHALVRLTDRLSIGDGVEIRSERGTVDNVITYIKDSRGQLVKTAEHGSLVEIGDLRLKGEIPEKGAEVYKLTDKKLSQEMRRRGSILPQRIPVRLCLYASVGYPLTVAGDMQDREKWFHAERSASEKLEPARSTTADREKLAEKLSRAGGTPYLCRETLVETDGNPYIKISLLNELRRQVLDDLTEQRLSVFLPSEEKVEESAKASRIALKADNCKEKTFNNPDILFQLYFYNTAGIDHRIRELLKKVRRDHLPSNRLSICLPLSLLKNPERSIVLLHEIEENGCWIDIVLPVELRRSGWTENRLEAVLNTVRAFTNFRAVIAAGAGQVSFLKKAGIPFEMDQHLNVLNAKSASFWLERGALSVCLTEEPEAFRLFAAGSVEKRCCVQLYGRIPVMYLEHCPIGSQGAEWWHSSGKNKETPCCSTNRKYYYCQKSEWILRDRTGTAFPVEADSTSCRAVVYSHKTIDRISLRKTLLEKGFRIFRIAVYRESAEDILKQIKKAFP